MGRLLVLALVVIVAGCAGLGSNFSGPYPAASPPGDLSGIWRGSLGWIGAYFYQDEATIDLRINDDGTFAATVTPNRGANNLAKPSKWAGTVVTRGDRITLRNTEGPWPWVTLKRSGDVLYGAAADPATQANVMMKFERDGSRG